jgi:hypothetical protein
MEGKFISYPLAQPFLSFPSQRIAARGRAGGGVRTNPNPGFWWVSGFSRPSSYPRQLRKGDSYRGGKIPTPGVRGGGVGIGARRGEWGYGSGGLILNQWNAFSSR